MCKTLLLGISGGTGAGKTHLVNRLMKEMRSKGLSTGYVALDWYYHDLSHLPRADRNLVNFDEPDAFDLELLDTHLRRLKSGHPVVAPSYDYVENVRLDEPHAIDVADVIFADGLFVLADAARRDLLDISVYLDVPDDIRLIRRLRRDVFDYGLTLEHVIDMWENTVKPMHDLHVASTAKYADLVLRYWQEDDALKAVDVLTRRIST
jgi:uridine kinase